MTDTARMDRENEYARSGDVNIAYQVVGDGPRDLVLVPGFVSHLEEDWTSSSRARSRISSPARGSHSPSAAERS